MIAGIKDILIGLTSEYESSEHSAALLYGLSLAQQSAAHVTTQSASVRVRVKSAWITQIAANLVGSENARRKAMAEALAKHARAEASAAGVDCTVQTPHLSFRELLASFTTQARLHDLTILDGEPEAINLDRGLIEELLMLAAALSSSCPGIARSFTAGARSWRGTAAPRLPGPQTTHCPSCGTPKPSRSCQSLAKSISPARRLAPISRFISTGTVCPRWRKV